MVKNCASLTTTLIVENEKDLSKSIRTMNATFNKDLNITINVQKNIPCIRMEK